jgi:putative endonuclease
VNSKLVGRWGEALAAEYLKKKKYKIIGMGYTTRLGEIDIIAENKKYIAFVEVKLRKSDDFAEAREFVTRDKQRRVIASAKLWLTYHETKKRPRFDIIEIYAPDGTDTKKPRIEHIENAFWENH